MAAVYEPRSRAPARLWEFGLTFPASDGPDRRVARSVGPIRVIFLSPDCPTLRLICWMIYQPPRKDQSPPLTPTQASVLRVVGQVLLEGRIGGLLTVREIIRGSNQPAVDTIMALCDLQDRGWLVCTGSIHVSNTDNCLPMAEGRRLAIELAMQDRKLSSGHRAPLRRGRDDENVSSRDTDSRWNSS